MSKMETVTNSFNLFIDSSRGHHTGSKGDDYIVNLQDSGVHAGEGEIIRMTLDNFSMAKVFTDVNDNNNKVVLRFADNTGVYQANEDVFLSNRNNPSVNDLASDFQAKIIEALNKYTALGTVSAHDTVILTPPASGASDNIISFAVKYTGTQLTAAAKINVQMFSHESDSYILLGGDRIEGPVSATSTKNSIDAVADTASPKITFTCRYPAQRSSMPFVYVRAPGVLNTNIETKSLRNNQDDHKSDTAHSDILGRVVVETSEWVQYTAQTGREFFLDIHQKQLNFLRLTLTDAHNRPLGRATNTTHPNTASGSGTEQSTLGNLNFSAVIRFDIIKKRTVQHLETEHYKPNVPARFSNGIVNQQRSGKDTFNMAPGF